MAKLPNSLLPRSLSTSTSSSLLTTASRPSITTTSTTTTISSPPAWGWSRPRQVRHATEIARPKRPYTFTQIVQLSDGSTYTARTTSPLPVLRSTKDTRNHLTWQPSEVSLKNVEVDEAGKLASFRSKFGTQYDLGEDPVDVEAEVAAVAAAAGGGARKDGRKVADAKADAEARADAAEKQKSATDSFAELMASYVRDEPNLKGGQVASNRVAKKGKKK